MQGGGRPIADNMKFLKLSLLVAVFLAPLFVVTNPASGVVAPVWNASQSVDQDYINVSATLSCPIGSTNRVIASGSVVHSTSSALGAPQTSGANSGSGYVAWSASWLRPANTTQQNYSVTVSVNATGLVCDQTGYTNTQQLTIVVSPLTVRVADLSLVTSGDPDAPNLNIYWWGGVAAATYYVEYRLNGAAWQYFYTGTDTARTWLSLPAGQHSFRVKAKRGSIESPSWTESVIQVGSIVTPTPTPTLTPTPTPAVTFTPSPTATSLPTLVPIVAPSAPTTGIPTVPTPRPSATPLPSSTPLITPPASGPTLVVANKAVTGFAGKTLTTTLKKSLTSLVKQHAVASHAICTGYYKTTTQLATAKAQAAATCAFLKSQDKTLITSVSTSKSTKTLGVQVSFKK